MYGNKRSRLNKEIGHWTGDADTARVNPIANMSLLQSVSETKSIDSPCGARSLTKTPWIKYDEIYSRNGCHCTPLPCQFGSFQRTDYAAWSYHISRGSKSRDIHESPK